MSFILDALRKSESERQREATPTLARVPFASARRQTPAWIWFVIGALSLALIAIAIGWWRTNQTAGVDTVPNAAELSVPDALSVPTAGTAAMQSPVAQPLPDRAAPVSYTGEPRPMSELAALDATLPSYALQFIEFNAARPEAGSAWINGSLYRPGERIPGGPELLEIRADAVVIGYRGGRFLLNLR